jgi:hypothetical protein
MFENLTPLQMELLKDGLATLLSEHDQDMSQEEILAAKAMHEALAAKLQA